MKNKLFLGTSLLFLIGVVSACAPEQTNTKEASQTDNIQVLTSFYPMYEFTRNIVGDEGEVEMLIPAGTEAHDYDPSAKDLKKLQDADVFVYNNENMETWLPSVENVFEEGGVTVIKATENMLLLPGDEAEHDHSHDKESHDHSHDEEDAHGHSHELDPHVWLSPNSAIKEVEEIRDQLVATYPEKAQAFNDNADSYLEKLTALDARYRKATKEATQTEFVTQHAAFGYLALDYGLKQVPIVGLSSNEEPSPAKLAALKTYVQDNHIHAIYFESNAASAIAETLAKEADVELLVLDTLEAVSEKDINDGKDYLSIMEDNLEALSKTLTSKNGTSLTTETTEKEHTVANGYFEDSAIEDRPLANWSGEWQSVYPLLQDGTLDQVFDYKAKLSKDMSAKEYKAYYEVGYKTTINNITITDLSMTFTDDQGKSVASEYKYAGYEILNYKAGNRGVRYTFEATDPSSGAYKYVQFSDHIITDTVSTHYHIYFGNESQEAVYEEVDNWPTYYHSDLSGQEIAQEMLAH